MHIEKSSFRFVNNNINLIEILPNPFTDQVQISVQSKNPFHIRISDITGKTYYQNSLLENVVDISTASWPIGVYFVYMVNDHGINEYKKLVTINQ